MPEAMAKGLLLKNAHKKQPRAADRQVATRMPLASIPVEERKTGLRKMI